MPGVRSAALADAPPYVGRGVFTLIREGEEFRRRSADQRRLLRDHRLRVVRGRTYTAQEAAVYAPVAVISETLAREFWPGVDPIGASFERKQLNPKLPPATVIGVVSDSITARLRDLRADTVYWPLELPAAGKLLVRTVGPPADLARSLRDALQPIDPGIRLDFKLVGDGLAEELDPPRLMASLSAALAVFALALALVGIYGVTSFVTGQRMREIGVRLALGATPGEVMQLLLADGLRPVSTGLVVGLIAGLLGNQAFAASSSHHGAGLIAFGRCSSCWPLDCGGLRPDPPRRARRSVVVLRPS